MPFDQHPRGSQGCKGLNFFLDALIQETCTAKSPADKHVINSIHNGRLKSTHILEITRWKRRLPMTSLPNPPSMQMEQFNNTFEGVNARICIHITAHHVKCVRWRSPSSHGNFGLANSRYPEMPGPCILCTSSCLYLRTMSINRSKSRYVPIF